MNENASHPQELRRQTITMKFGGTSVGSAEAILRVAGIVQRTGENSLHSTGSTPRRVAVIASAMSGVTNELIHVAHVAVEGDEAEIEATIARLRQRHEKTIDALGLTEAESAVVRPHIDGMLSEVRSLCRATAVLRELTPCGPATNRRFHRIQCGSHVRKSDFGLSAFGEVIISNRPASLHVPPAVFVHKPALKIKFWKLCQQSSNHAFVG